MEASHDRRSSCCCGRLRKAVKRGLFIIPAEGLLPAAVEEPLCLALRCAQAGAAGGTFLRRDGCRDCGGIRLCRDDQLRHIRCYHHFCIAVLLVLQRVVPADCLLSLAIAGIPKLLGLGWQQAGAGGRALNACGNGRGSNQQAQESQKGQGQDPYIDPTLLPCIETSENTHGE